MNRRQVLTCCGLATSFLLSGCVQSPGDEGPDDTGSPAVPVTVVSQDDQPSVPNEYGVEMVDAQATDDRPARLRVTISNESDATLLLGEERGVKFHHVSSTEAELYLHPAGEDSREAPVEPGCWRLTDHVAIPEYYGVVTLDPGETIRPESVVYGHPDLPDGDCLPAGEYRLRTAGVAGDDEEQIPGGADAREFEWGFTLRVGE